MEGESKGTREGEGERGGERENGREREGGRKEGTRVRGVWVRSAAWLTSENE